MTNSVNWVFSNCITRTVTVSGVEFEKAVISFEARVGADNGEGISVPPRVRAPNTNPVLVGEPNPETFVPFEDPGLTHTVMLSWINNEDREAAEAAAIISLEAAISEEEAKAVSNEQVGLPPAATEGSE